MFRTAGKLGAALTAAAMFGGGVGAAASSHGLPLAGDRSAPLLPRMFAVVESYGTPIRGKGIVSVRHRSAGFYIVKFNRSIQACSWNATIGYGGTGGAPFASFINASGWSSNEILVQTFDGSGAFWDFDFLLTVTCS